MKNKAMLNKIITYIIILIPLAGVCQRKSALIICNNDYRFSYNKGSSAKQCTELKEELIGLGFEVTLIINGSKGETQKAFYAFLDDGNEISFFFYTGYIAKNIITHEFYLVPPGEEIYPPREYNLFSLRQIEENINRRELGLKILMFDIISPPYEEFSLRQGIDFYPKIADIIDSHRNDEDIIIATNQLPPKTPHSEGGYLRIFIEELKKPNQSIKNTFNNLSSHVKSVSLHSPFVLNTSLFMSAKISELLWNGRLYQDIETMPKFPFPPPKASASHLVEKKYFEKVDNLFEAGKILDSSLLSCGYHERSYYQIPEGFALVTRIEKIRKDVSPLPEPERWAAPYDPKYGNFSLKNYFESLFVAKTGKYRIIVFLVTSLPFNQTEDEMSLTVAEKYVKRGYDSLPYEFQSIKYSKEHKCTALIYEFNKVEYEKGQLVELSDFLGSAHLTKNNFIPILTKNSK